MARKLAMANETMPREVEKKENYFSVQVLEGEPVDIVVNGVITASLVIPYDGKMRCYLARERASITYK